MSLFIINERIHDKECTRDIQFGENVFRNQRMLISKYKRRSTFSIQKPYTFHFPSVRKKINGC